VRWDATSLPVLGQPLEEKVWQRGKDGRTRGRPRSEKKWLTLGRYDICSFLVLVILSYTCCSSDKGCN